MYVHAFFTKLLHSHLFTIFVLHQPLLTINVIVITCISYRFRGYTPLCNICTTDAPKCKRKNTGIFSGLSAAILFISSFLFFLYILFSNSYLHHDVSFAILLFCFVIHDYYCIPVNVNPISSILSFYVIVLFYLYPLYQQQFLFHCEVSAQILSSQNAASEILDIGSL